MANIVPMMANSVTAKDAISLYKAKKYDDALDCANRLEKDDRRVGLLLIGLIYELGLGAGGVDLIAANRAFAQLAVSFDDDEGFLGQARTFIALGNIEAAAKPLQHADDLGNPFAAILLGDASEARGAHSEALRHYWRATFRGVPWGLRRAGYLHWKLGNYIRSIAIHTIATIIFPFFAIFGKASVSRSA